MSTYHLRIMTPEREFFNGEVEGLIVTVPDGELGIFAGHLPLVAPLVVGSIRLKIDGEWKEAFNSEGFIEVGHDDTVLFTQACEWPEDIDVVRAEEALRRAQEKIRQRRSIAEHKGSKISLARAMARLRVASHKLK